MVRDRAPGPVMLALGFEVRAKGTGSFRPNAGCVAGVSIPERVWLNSGVASRTFDNPIGTEYHTLTNVR
jgi:hypothetical protein